jgi:2-amino-4-hydroxy-6-hydroxymethyldihydropteridine diphosphokinase
MLKAEPEDLRTHDVLKNTAVISLGSNKGDRAKNLREALSRLLSETAITLSGISSIYRTEPVDDEEQPFFYNATACLKTRFGAREFFNKLFATEAFIGKEKERMKGPRRIDLDFLFFNNEVLQEKNLIVPHPSIEKRLFVLKPLMEICPFYVHPVLRRAVRELYFELKTEKKAVPVMAFPC